MQIWQKKVQIWQLFEQHKKGADLTKKKGADLTMSLRSSSLGYFGILYDPYVLQKLVIYLFVSSLSAYENHNLSASFAQPRDNACELVSNLVYLEKIAIPR